MIYADLQPSTYFIFTDDPLQRIYYTLEETSRFMSVQGVVHHIEETRDEYNTSVTLLKTVRVIYTPSCQEPIQHLNQ